MRIPSLFAAVAVVLQLVACSGTSTGTGGTGAGNGTGAAGQGGPGGSATGGGTCDSLCSYYIQCKGPGAPDQASCVSTCESLGVTSEQAGQVEALDCPAAVAAVETPASPPPGNTPKPKAADCDGCQHDGTSCIWISPSTGLHQACAASCC